MAIKYVSKTFFTYEVDFDQNLTPGNSAALTFNVNGDSDFFWQKFYLFALVANAGTTRDLEQLAAIAISITNTTTGRQYNNTPVPVGNLMSYRQFLPMMTVWPRKSTVLINLTNFDSLFVTYSKLQLAFMGTKAFTTVAS